MYLPHFRSFRLCLHAAPIRFVEIRRLSLNYQLIMIILERPDGLTSRLVPDRGSKLATHKHTNTQTNTQTKRSQKSRVSMLVGLLGTANRQKHVEMSLARVDEFYTR